MGQSFMRFEFPPLAKEGAPGFISRRGPQSLQQWSRPVHAPSTLSSLLTAPAQGPAVLNLMAQTGASCTSSPSVASG